MAAPIQLTIAQRTEDHLTYELVLTATLTADVEDLSLRLDRKTEAFGARKQGDILTLATTVTVARGEGMDAIGGATVKRGERVLTAAIAERVGAVEAPANGRVVDVPGVGPVSGEKQ